MGKHWFIAILIGASLPCLAVENSEQAIIRRIQPVGSVYLADGEQATVSEQHHVAKTMHHEAPAHATGQEIYTNYCYICHAEGAAGAPIVGDQKAWQPRRNKGLSVLIQHALDGYRLMPPRGTCLECSDKEIAAAVKYMIEKQTA